MISRYVDFRVISVLKADENEKFHHVFPVLATSANLNGAQKIYI